MSSCVNLHERQPDDKEAWADEVLDIEISRKRHVGGRMLQGKGFLVPRPKSLDNYYCIALLS